MTFPRILPVGDAALVVEFGDEIHPDIHRRVLALDHALAADPFPGLRETVPTYRSLLVYYDPRQLSWDEARRLVANALARSTDTPMPEPREVEIPVVYGGEFGPDIGFVAAHTGLSEEEVVRLHTSVTYTVYMLGFAPGFVYLGGLPEALATPRLPTPRPSVPAGSVGIAGLQTGIYGLSTPGGWRLIGRTLLTMLDLNRQPPTLLQPGDRVRFVPTG
jgi:KipI family sensor histidine kinase inhibitor